MAGGNFDRPKTRFVAEFIGKANILTGRLDGDGRSILCDGMTVRVADASSLGPSTEVAVCVRPHSIRLFARQEGSRQLTGDGHNLFAGVIRRSIYFGDAVDYTVELASGRVLRVIAPPAQRFELGQSICAAIHPENCVVVREH